MQRGIVWRMTGVICSSLLLFHIQGAFAQTVDLEPKPASPATIARQEQARESLPADDGQDEEFVHRGFIATLADPVIRGADGRVIFDATRYDWIQGEAPPTVNPGLWRQQKLLRVHGLFKVRDGVWQIRGLSTANMTIVRGETGWIIVDTMASVEAASRARQLIDKYLGKRPISAIIYSHSHPDHFAGARAFVNEGDTIPILAPEHFMEETLAEWGKAGAATSRRGNFIAGPREAGPRANVGMGIASAVDTGGTMSLIPPTDIIRRTGEIRKIDGVSMEFQMVPDTEAPAEMNVFFPEQKALYIAEITSCTMHNLQAPRGAPVRDGLAWANDITEAIRLFGDRTDALAMGHCWPRFGKAAVNKFLGMQRDNYKFIHDQTLRLMNNGLTPTEIAEELHRPKALGDDWSNQDFYGVMRHNVKGVYQRYSGWWSGIPAQLDMYPPEELGKRYVKAMGGPGNVVREARRAMGEGDYRWSSELLNQLVFAEPNDVSARELLADSYEQLGYQAGSAAWRNIYLWAAAELRGARPYDVWPEFGELADLLPLQSLLDMEATMLVPEKAGDRKFSVALEVTDRKENALITVNNAVMISELMDNPGPADVSLRGSVKMLMNLFLKRQSLEQLEKDGMAVNGDRQVVTELLEITDLPKKFFPVVAPTRIDIKQ